MINIHGTKEFRFSFPAPIEDTFAFFSAKIPHLADFMPHIELIEAFDSAQYRLKYSATELGTYEISVLCDVIIEAEPDRYAIVATPDDGPTIVRPRSGMKSTVGPGEYASISRFTPAGGATIIDFSLRLNAQLPRPLSMRWMPRKTVDQISNAITTRRIDEIANGFIENSIAGFPLWKANHIVS